MVDTALAWRLGDAPSLPEGYRTYILFVNASAAYPDRAAADTLRTLERNFKRFGDSIGDSHLAVWVNERGQPALSVSRGKYYVDLVAKWSRRSIEYSDGPFVIVSSRHPRDLDRPPMPGDPTAVVIGFREIAPTHIVEVLNLIEARIRREEVLTSSQFRLALLWVRLQSWWDTTNNEFFKKAVLALIEKL
jgi:hypothetical protein